MGYAIPVAALIFSAIVTYMNVRTVRNNVDEVDRSSLVNLGLAQAEVGVQAMSRSSRGYLLDPSSVSEDK